MVQVLSGLDQGEQVVAHSQRGLTARTRIRIVDTLSGGRR